MKLLYPFIFLFSFTYTFSQSHINEKLISLPSANTASLGKYGDVPVSHHTGVPNVSVLLYTIENGNISVPITLSYHASGVKVEDLASWVGLGWSLNAGGMISRNIVGGPDEGREPYQGTPVGTNSIGWYENYGIHSVLEDCFCTPNDPFPYNFPLNGPSCADLMLGVTKGRLDTQPDVFNFNVGGYSGKFVFDENRQAQIFPKQDLKIEVNYTPDGGTVWENITQDSCFYSWKLITPDGTKYYFGGNGATELGYTDGTGGITSHVDNFTNSAWYLTKIESANNTYWVEFEYADENYLQYSRPVHTYSPPVTGQVGGGGAGPSFEYIPGWLAITNTFGKRLTQITTNNAMLVEFNADTEREDLPNSYRLDSLSITIGSSKKIFDLEYDYFESDTLPYVQHTNTDTKRLKLLSVTERTASGLSLPPHTFEYNSNELPRRLSLARDHWGYYNGADGNTGLIPTIASAPWGGYYAGANRDPNSETMDGWILEKITYPTGGNTKFIYEPHYSGTNLVGGMRIQKVQSHDGDGGGWTKTYEYQSGNLYAGYPTWAHYVTHRTITGTCLNGIQPSLNWWVTFATSNPHAPLKLTTQGYHIGYSIVDEVTQGNGYSRYKYYNIAPSPCTPQSAIQYPCPPTVYEIGTGELYSTTHYKEDSSEVYNKETHYLLDQESFQYPTLVSNFSRPGFVNGVNQPVDYTMKIARYIIDYEVETKDGVTVTTNYEYSNNHNFPIEISFSNSNNDVHKTKNYYPLEASWQSGTEDEAIDTLIARHMIGSPLRIEQYVNGQQVSGSWTEYKMFPGVPGLIDHVQPHKLYSYEGGWYQETVINSYNTKDRPTEIQQTGWDPETYNWQGDLLLGRTFNNWTWGWTWTDFRQLDSFTDKDGQTINYNYDGFQRLTTTTQRQSNVITNITYNLGLAGGGENYIETHQQFSNFDDQYTKQTFDGLGRPLETIRLGYGPDGGNVVVNELVYDPIVNRVVQKTHLPGSLTSIGYEPSPLNRPNRETFPDGFSVSTDYGSSDNYYKVTVTNENGNPTETRTDILGRTDKIIDAKGGTTIYTYSDQNYLTQVTNPLSQTYNYSYDIHNRLRFKKIPGAECQEFVYDVRDLVIASQDGNLRQDGKWIANEYDAYGRVTKSGFYDFASSANCNFVAGSLAPPVPSNFIPTADEMLTENVYDAYGSGQKPAGCLTGDTDIILKGRLTYTKARVMENGNLTSTVETGFCYDEYGREIGSEVFNSPHGTDKYLHTLDIADHLTSTNRVYSGGIEYTKQYDYDHGGRLAESKFNMGGLGNPNPVTLAKNTYNNRDELIGKALGGAFYNVGQSSVFQYLQKVDYSFNVRGFLTAINQMPFKPTLPIPTCETPIPPLPPGNPPNNCAECGDEIVTVQELLKLRWELDMNVDCYVPCDCELRCDTDCEEEGNGTTDPSGDIPTDNPSAAELNLPTYLVQIEDCDGDTSLVLADSLINVYGDYSMIGMIELSDDDNQEFRVETTTGDRTIGLDSLLNLIDNGEVIDVKTDNEGNCDECILDPPDCNPADQTAQSNYLSSLGSNPASLTYPTLLHRVRLCDGSEVYLFEEELNSLPGNYIILQTIQIENSSQILIQLLNDGCTTNWTVGGFQQVRTFNSDWNINHYIPCDQQDCSTLYDETINASSVSNSLNFETELNFYPTSSNLIQIYPGSSESLLIDGITWNISENVLGTGEVEYYINNGLSPNSTILDYEVKIVIPEASGYFTFYLALFDGVSFVPINGGQDYLYYPFLNYPNNSIPNEIILKPDALPTGMQASQMRLVFLKYSEGGVFKIDGISLDVKHIGTCDDVCNEQDPVCSTEELENQQASLDSIQTLWNETPLSDLELPTKLYRVKLCDGSEVYLLQHELSILEGNYLILQSIDINELSETHLFKKTGVDGEALDANDLFALKLKYYNGDQQINNTVGQGYGNGNIAAQYWQVAGRDRQAYGYRYDELDRVIFGKYADITENDEYYNKDHYSVDLFNAYDAIGNITRLSREGPISECIAPDSSILYSYGNIDRLQYLYNNDKTHLIGVNEYSISRGFKATTAYTYDDNGNLISDSGKGITEIKYNHLNLPYEVVFGNGNKIRWMYDATGKKLRKNVIGGGQTNQIDYIDGIEKDQINGDFVYHEEGRVYLTSVIDPVSSEVIIPSGTMAYTIKDHLGNARVTFADLDGNGWITIQDIASTPEEEPQELLQENHYYPFGMNMEGSWFPQVGESDKYQYNGIERNKDFGLDWDLAEFRSYDAAIGRWVQVDPLAELAYNWTPYRNAFNNPIKYIDPFGLFETKKEARQERRGQRRKARRNGEKWKGAKIKKNSEGRYDVRYKGSDGYVTRNESGDLEYGAVTRDPNAIRQYEPNFFERVENSGFWGNLLYSVANDASLTLQRFNPFDTQTTHLSNHIASKDEYTMGFVNTTMTAVPMARTQDAVIKVAHHGILRRLNAAQFSKFFKGTFLARMSPKMRGFINKQLNSKVIDKVATGNISYTTISISSTLVNKNSE